MAGSRLQETQSGHNKGQNAIASNWRGNQQTQGGKMSRLLTVDYILFSLFTLFYFSFLFLLIFLFLEHSG